MWATLLIILLAFVAIGLLPNWAHMRRFDLAWFPSGAALALAVVLAVLMLAGKL